MKLVSPIIILLVLIGIAAGVAVSGSGGQFVMGVVVPYAAFAIFVVGFVMRVLSWMRSPVPFNITTTAGQQKSLSWIKNQELENPTGLPGVIGRMALEVLLFRSLFRNSSTNLHEGRLVHDSNKWLWTFAMVFHWSFLLVFLRHIRFFVSEIPAPIMAIETFDSILQVGVPALYITDLLLVAGVTLLFLRRVVIPYMRYLSFPQDYFPLLVIFGIAASGILMRYFMHVDIMGVKALTMGLVTFSPVVPHNIAPIFFIHLFLVSVLFAYFPFSKLMHMGGIWLSPTRNMPGNTRMIRHENPWNYEVKIHTYAEYEDDFREKMKDAGLPVEKE